MQTAPEVDSIDHTHREGDNNIIIKNYSPSLTNDLRTQQAMSTQMSQASPIKVESENYPLRQRSRNDSSEGPSIDNSPMQTVSPRLVSISEQQNIAKEMLVVPPPVK